VSGFRSTGWVPNLTTNHCIYACYVHFYKNFKESSGKVAPCWFQTMKCFIDCSLLLQSWHVGIKYLLLLQ
jgi:hypothetical protein